MLTSCRTSETCSSSHEYFSNLSDHARPFASQPLFDWYVLPQGAFTSVYNKLTYRACFVSAMFFQYARGTRGLLVRGLEPKLRNHLKPARRSNAVTSVTLLFSVGDRILREFTSPRLLKSRFQTSNSRSARAY